MSGKAASLQAPLLAGALKAEAQVGTNGELTLSDVAAHNTEGDCWVSIEGHVYKIRPEFFAAHPGGPMPLRRLAGKDASRQFLTQHPPAVVSLITGKKDRPGASPPGDLMRPSAHIDYVGPLGATPSTAVAGEEGLYDLKNVDAAKAEELFDGIKGSYPWRVYAVGFVHMAVYLSVYVITYCGMQGMLPGFLQGPSPVWWSIPWGWAFYCVWMIGHESYHNTMAPPTTDDSVVDVNGWLGFLCVDCIAVSKATWVAKHNELHHGHPWGDEPQDRQRLFGPNVLVETVQVFYTLLTYWHSDLRNFLADPTLAKVVSTSIRFLILLSLPLNCLVGAVFSTLIVANYMALLAHSLPKLVRDPDSGKLHQLEGSDGVVEQIQTTIDIFPHSKLVVFLSGALNNHCVHHVFPALPRSLHPWASAKLRKYAPGEYRAVEDMASMLALWVQRHDVVEVTEAQAQVVATSKDGFAKIPPASASRTVRQLLADGASLVPLFAIAACAPQVSPLSWVGQACSAQFF